MKGEQTMSEAERPDQKKEGIPLSDAALKLLEELPVDSTIEICKNQQIPVGYVIVGQGINISCPPPLPNTWKIKRPGLTEIICSVSPIPANYVVTGTGFDAACPGVSFPNTKTIQQV
jgi:hypothetical protein